MTKVLGPEHERLVWEAVLAIAHDLGQRADALGKGGQGPESAGGDGSLADGHAGIALFFHALAETERGGDVGAAVRRDQFLEAALGALSSQSMDASLYGGFSGIAWALQHIVAPPADAADVADPLASVDDALSGYLARAASGELDLISGSVGMGVYLLDRLPRASARAGLSAIVEQLEKRAEQRANGVTWRVQPSELDADDRALYPEGRYDLGVAHGVPGIIAFLGRVLAAGAEKERAGRLFDGSVEWLLAQVDAHAPSPRFPYWTAPIGPARATRVSWCYGDLGVALALLAAASAANRADLHAYALELARSVAQRSTDSAGIIDGGLCHGSAGAAHLFHRLYAVSGEKLFADASRYWFEQTLSLRREGTGIGGFRSVIRDRDLNDVWIDSPEFLNGAAGIGLGLLAGLGLAEPSFDRVLLISPLAVASMR